jgi:Tol biopolymer transport system component
MFCQAGSLHLGLDVWTAGSGFSRWLRSRAPAVGVGLLFGAAGLASCGSGVPQADSPVIAVVNLDGTGRVDLVAGEDPAWSVDGTRIAIVREGRIVVVDEDGRNQRDLGPGEDPAWSPDGSWIAFRSGDDTDPHIAITSAGGGMRFDLADGMHPVWSPNGTQIAFMDGYAVKTYGPGGRIRTLSVEQDLLETRSDPVWSASGDIVAYIEGSSTVLAASTDGDRLDKILAPVSLSLLHGLAWSTDGTQLAVACLVVSYHLCTVPPAGGPRLDRHEEFGSFSITIVGPYLAWAPVGRKIAWVGALEPTDRMDLFVFELGTGERRMLLRNADGTPSWSPDGTRIAVEAIAAPTE